MSNKQRRYRAVRQALDGLYPAVPTGNLARHLNTLAGLISGIVGSRRVNLPDLAGQVPDGTKKASREKRFQRFIKNEQVNDTIYFLPFARALLCSLAQHPLVLVIDGSDVGRGCVTLMVSVIYQKRALPVAWIVVEGGKGHFPEAAHVALVEQVRVSGARRQPGHLSR